MRAAVLHAARDLRLEERSIPKPGDGEILLEVKSAALCGTDMRMWANGVDSPRVLGHEMAGVIAEVGRGVRGYLKGDRVAIAPNMGCGICDECVAGRGHMCPDYQALGINLDGAFAEYVLIPEQAVRGGNVSPLGESIGFSEAAIVEPLSCVYNAFEHYRVEPGDCVLIIGAGPIGAMHAKFARMAGASKVILNDLSAERLLRIAAVEPGIIPYCGDGLKEFIMDETKGKGVNVCVTACPAPAAQMAALPLMALYGRVCFFGGLPKAKEIVPLNANLIHYRQLTVTGTSRSSLSQYRKCLALVDGGVVDLRAIITDEYPLHRICEAFEFAAAAGGLKTVLSFNGGGIA